ncbi:periplasmic heavy metal sensor [bacterium]|nr:periplasmic heavy metal sensor [bacterium]
MKRALLFVLLISVGLNIGLAVSYHRSRDEAPQADSRYGPGHGPGSHDPADPRHDRPDRGDGEGRGRLKEMHARLEPELAEHRVAVQGARAALREAMSREDVDEDEIMELVGAMVAAQGRIDSLVASNLVRELSDMPPGERQQFLRRMPWMRRQLGGRGRGSGPGSP